MNCHFSRFITDKLLDFLKRLDRKVTTRISAVAWMKRCKIQEAEPQISSGLRLNLAPATRPHMVPSDFTKDE